MQSIGYIPNTFEDKMIHMLVDRSRIEQEAMKRLKPKEQEIIRLKYYELMDGTEIAKKMGISHTWARMIERDALRKLRYIILMEKTDIVDFKTGMTEADWWYLASAIARMLEYYSTDTANIENRCGVLRQWAKDIIIWRLTSDERQILLWYHQIKPYPGKLNSDYYETVEGIHKKILGFLTKDNLICEKANYKVRV